MRLGEQGEEMPVPETTNGNGVHGVTSNGNGVHFPDMVSDDSEEEEEAEPVSATLVLRVVSEPPSPALSRKPSFRRDQPPSFLADNNDNNNSGRGEQYLQVTD